LASSAASAATLCTIEFFHGTPGPCRIEPCVIKILAFRRRRRSENKKRLREQGARRGASRPLPVQWIITSGWPGRALEGFAFERALRMGPGVYRAPRELATHLVVASELPETRDTLLVRLVAGKDGVQERAREEVLALPPDAPERRLAGPIMVELWPELARKRARRSKDAEEFRAMFQPVVDAYD
jgi:hypothetical protein